MSHTSQTTRPLQEYLDALHREGILLSSPDATSASLTIANATDDSRDVRPQTLFVCKGATFRREYLLDAIEAGAVAYVAEQDFGVSIPAIIVSDIRRALGITADLAWNHPSEHIDICAITGTRGKTTTAYCLRSILQARAERLGLPRCPLFSTITLDDGIEVETSTLTTPEPFDLQRHIANAVASGSSALVMEASSQALKYGRMRGVELAVGAFTNISEDHISPIEHPTFEDYFASKLRLFEKARTAVVNLDMKPECRERVLSAASACERTITCSTTEAEADLRTVNIRHERGGIAFELTAGPNVPELNEPLAVRLPMLGLYNAENALIAAACALAVGATAADIRAGLEAVHIPGRMEIVHQEDGLTVIVDYAHNGSSLEALLTDVRDAYPNHEVTCVFGATGTKGVERRYGMGETAGRLADRIIVTEDDPGKEDPALIAQEIEQAAREAGATNITTILDRREAARHAIEGARRPAVVILAGKGHETFVVRGTERLPYEGDAAVIRSIVGQAE